MRGEFTKEKTVNSCLKSKIIALVMGVALLAGCSGDGGFFNGLSSVNPSSLGGSEGAAADSGDGKDAKCTAKKAILQKSAFHTSRIFHHPSTLEGSLTLQASGPAVVAVTEEFVALKKAQCELSSSWLSMVQVIHEPPTHPSMKRHAFTFNLKNPMSVDKIEHLSSMESCLLSISKASSEEKVFAPSDWTDSDPNSVDQAWINDIQLPKALDEFFHKDYGIKQDVIVADIDTGVYFFHEDLHEQVLWKQPNGLIGYNVLQPSQDAQDDLTTGGGQAVHGSKIAGIIGAVSGNSKGIVGMFPRNVKVMAVKYISSMGSAKPADRINGFEYAVANGADVINLSLGFSSNEVTFRQMIEDFVAGGGFVATAAGNEGSLVSTSTGRYPVVWAKDIDGMMSVGGTDSGSKNLWSGSNYGTSTVEIAAPGGSVFTTIPWHPGLGKFGNYYGSTSGTSFSSPMVAAAAGMVIGLLKSNNISYTAKDIEDLIVAGSAQVPGLKSFIMGGRMLDMEKLAQAIFEKHPEIKGGSGGASPGPAPVICP